MLIRVVAVLVCVSFTACTCSETRRSDHDLDSGVDASTDSGSDSDSDADVDGDAGSDGGPDSGSDAGDDCGWETKFQDQVVYNLPFSPLDVVALDFDGDGILDLISESEIMVGEIEDRVLAVQYGNGDGGVGDGTFSDVVTLGEGGGPVILADFNGDGIVDFAGARFLESILNVRLGNGVDGVSDGTFADPVVYTTDTGPNYVHEGDFNGDEVVDLVVVHTVAMNVGIFLGLGDAGFASMVTFPVGLYPTFVEVADLNEDGILDLAVASNSSDTVNILYGEGEGGIGDGTFSIEDPYPVGSHPRPIVASDFNGDGHPDLAVANYESNDISVLLGKGWEGVPGDAFEDQVTYVTGTMPQNLSTADFENDGILDLAVDNFITGTVGVFKGRGHDGIGDGTFCDQVSFAVQSKPAAIAAADFNADGLLDMAVPNAASDSVSILLGEWCE